MSAPLDLAGIIAEGKRLEVEATRNDLNWWARDTALYARERFAVASLPRLLAVAEAAVEMREGLRARGMSGGFIAAFDAAASAGEKKNETL
jgi:hypothetical protein